MSELLLVSNPKRRRKKKHSRKGRMPPALKKYWASRRAGKATPKRRRRKNPKRAHHRKGKHRAVGYTVGTRKIRRRKLNPHRRHRARYRRRSNPMSLGGFTNSLMPTMKAGAWGAGGALGLDAIWGLITTNLPSIATYLTNPYVTFIAKALAAAGVGTLGGHLVKGRGRDLAVGAMTTTIHDFLKSQLQSLAPTIFAPGGTLSLGAYLSDYNNPSTMGAYLSGAAPIMGTASIPQAYLPFSGFAGSSGMSDGNMYTDDRMGLDPWGS